MSQAKIFHGGGSAKGGGFSSSGGGIDLNDKAAVTIADSTPNFLGSKIVAGTGIALAVLNPGANENLQISNSVVNTDINAKISAADTTTGYLNSKIVVDSTLTKTILNPGANETLQLKLTDTPPKKRYTLIFGTGSSLGVNAFIPAPTAGTTYPVNTCGHYILKNSKIVQWGIIVTRFTSYNLTSYTRFQLKKINVASALAADITIASGTNLVNYDMPYNRNTGGAFGYYQGGGETGKSYSLSAGDMLFVCICAQTVNSATGCAIHVVCEED